MIPWWGVLIACFFFGMWSILCFMVGAALKEYAVKEAKKGSIIQRNMANAKDN